MNSPVVTCVFHVIANEAALLLAWMLPFLFELYGMWHVWNYADDNLLFVYEHVLQAEY